MRTFNDPCSITGALRTSALLIGVVLAAPTEIFAASPWEDLTNKLEVAFTGPIARGLSLVAIVVAGLMWAFGDGDGKRQLAGVLFGVAMAVSAVNFMYWLFP